MIMFKKNKVEGLTLLSFKSYSEDTIIKTVRYWHKNSHITNLCIENRKDSTQKLLELISEFSKVAGYKIKLWKSAVFLYTNNEISTRECKKTILFKIAPKKC